MTNNTHIIDIFSELVASLRKTGIITNIVDNTDNTYTLTVTNVSDLSINDYITIAGSGAINTSNARVIAKSNSLNTITVSLTSGKVISTFGTWTSNKPYFYYGKDVEAANYLSYLEKSNTFKLQKFPLIYLTLDINENRDTIIKTIPSLKLYLITESQQNYTNIERLNVYKTVLIPLYEDIIENIQNNFYFVLDNKNIEHQYVERFFLGSESQNQNILNQVCEAIELTFNNLRIKQFVSKCK